MKITKNIIKRLLRKHRSECRIAENIGTIKAKKHIEDHLKLPFKPNVIGSDVVVTIPENLYFNSDYEYIQDVDYVKIVNRNSMITSYGVVMCQMASQEEYFVHRFIMVLDDSQYEYWFTTAAVLNEQSVKVCLELFAKTVNTAHQTYVMNNETCFSI